MLKWCWRLILAGFAGLALIWVLYLSPWPHLVTVGKPTNSRIAPFSHVFVIVMENEGGSRILGNPQASYINQLAQRYGLETNYFGVTHPSLPNYAAFISGGTWGSHSDNPGQSFAVATLIDQLQQHHIAWQEVMQSMPSPGYTGYWYPASSTTKSAVAMPPGALYAKKHNPLLLFPQDVAWAATHTVNLRGFSKELQSGSVPRFEWITPNLCDDMHGQTPGPSSVCPEANSASLLQHGNQFLATWVPRIMASPAFSGNAVIFITWDETNGPSHWTPGPVRNYLAPGPAASPVLAALPWLGKMGGGQVPLIVVARQGPHPERLNWWSDHYSVLKTIEASWGLKLLGHAGSASVPLLGPFFNP